MIVLLLAFLVVPIVELWAIITVARSFGVLETIGLLIVISALGAWLVKRQGLSILGRIQRQVNAGTMPTTELVDGGLVMLAGALLLTPGFVTDALAVLLLLPPTRLPIRGLLMRRWRRRGPQSARVIRTHYIDLTREHAGPAGTDSAHPDPSSPARPALGHGQTPE